MVLWWNYCYHMTVWVYEGKQNAPPRVFIENFEHNLNELLAFCHQSLKIEMGNIENF